MSDKTLIDPLSNIFERGEIEQLNSVFGGVKGLSERLNTNIESGLSDDEAVDGYAERKGKWGQNILPDPPSKTWWQLFTHTFHDMMLQLLLALSFAGLLLSIFANHGQEDAWVHYIDPVAILICVLIVSCSEAQVNYQQQQSFNEVSKAKNSFIVNVRRNGELRPIQNTELLAGDLLDLKAGDAVPCDCIYLRGRNLRIDNSQNTGETTPLAVTESSPLIPSGAAVESGEAVVLVCVVGPYSQFGRTLQRLEKMNENSEKTPLQEKLDHIVVQVTYLGLAGTLLTFAVLFIIWIVKVTRNPWQKIYLSNLMDDIMVSITMFIGAIPEGLPLAVVISLGFSMKKMMKDNNFVRHLKACETMGGATTICSDKTGTLTQNRMTVVGYFMDNTDFDGRPNLDANVLSALSDSIALNTAAFMVVKDDPNKPEYVGKSTECALVKMLHKVNVDFNKIREANPERLTHEFNSTRKRMSTVVKMGDKYRVFAKGAPEIMIERCKFYMNLKGEILPLDVVQADNLIQKTTSMAKEQLRTILVAFADLNGDSFDKAWEEPDNVEKDLVVIGICGISDPLRPEVPDAIKQCKQAGVIVRMVTGDNIHTAKAIAKQCGILTDEGIAMIGKEFSAMKKTQILSILPKLQVLARSSPLDKYRLVSLLMESGETVAVTGDGSNDSIALRKADIGLAMGMCGTELAKMASDIVILDDNFLSIVAALKWGRCIYDNVRSFLQFQLTVNVCALIATFVGSIVLKEAPMRAIMLLWVSLIMDSIGALALATKGPSESLLNRPPYGESGQLISPLMYKNIVFHAVYQAIVLLMILFGADVFFGVNLARKYELQTFFFNTFVFFQVFNLLNARIADENAPFFEGLFENKIFWMLFFIISAIQAFLIEFGGRIMGTIGLNWKLWLWSVGLGSTELIVGIFGRLIKTKDNTREKLYVYREERNYSIRRKYTGMTPSMMWRKTDEVLP